MAFEDLSGPQKKVLRFAIVDAFTAATLNMFLVGDLNKPALGVIVASGPFEQQVFDLIEVARSEGWTEELIAGLQAARPANRVVRNLPDAMRMAASQVPPSAVSAGMTLEKIVRDAGFVDLHAWSDKLVGIGQATCRIEYAANGGKGYGTGILVADDMVLTNFHVVQDYIENGHSGAGIGCRFDYARDAKGLDQGRLVPLADGAAWVLAHSPYDPADVSGVGNPAPDNLDFALLRLSESIGAEEINGGKRRRIAVARNFAPKPKAPVFIVQHPEGGPMVMAIGVVLDNAGLAELRLRYDTDTKPGSSGSGVFDQNLNLVALHHAGDPKAKLSASYNAGIPIGRIIDRLVELNVAPFWQ
jgi:hypothetical protein